MSSTPNRPNQPEQLTDNPAATSRRFSFAAGVTPYDRSAPEGSAFQSFVENLSPTTFSRIQTHDPYVSGHSRRPRRAAGGQPSGTPAGSAEPSAFEGSEVLTQSDPMTGPQRLPRRTVPSGTGSRKYDARKLTQEIKDNLLIARINKRNLFPENDDKNIVIQEVDTATLDACTRFGVSGDETTLRRDKIEFSHDTMKKFVASLKASSRGALYDEYIEDAGDPPIPVPWVVRSVTLGKGEASAFKQESEAQYPLILPPNFQPNEMAFIDGPNDNQNQPIPFGAKAHEEIFYQVLFAGPTSLGKTSPAKLAPPRDPNAMTADHPLVIFFSMVLATGLNVFDEFRAGKQVTIEIDPDIFLHHQNQFHEMLKHALGDPDAGPILRANIVKWWRKGCDKADCIRCPRGKGKETSVVSRKEISKRYGATRDPTFSREELRVMMEENRRRMRLAEGGQEALAAAAASLALRSIVPRQSDVVSLRRSFQTIRYQPSHQPLSSYVKFCQASAESLRSRGIPTTEQDLIVVLTSGLPPEYDMFLSSLNLLPEDQFNFRNVTSQLMAFHRRYMGYSEHSLPFDGLPGYSQPSLPFTEHSLPLTGVPGPSSIDPSALTSGLYGTSASTEQPGLGSGLLTTLSDMFPGSQGEGLDYPRDGDQGDTEENFERDYTHYRDGDDITMGHGSA